ncbi:hypothetical protein D3C81_1922470 [compost metagenome]
MLDAYRATRERERGDVACCPQTVSGAHFCIDPQRLVLVQLHALQESGGRYHAGAQQYQWRLQAFTVGQQHRFDLVPAFEPLDLRRAVEGDPFALMQFADTAPDAIT